MWDRRSLSHDASGPFTYPLASFVICFLPCLFSFLSDCHCPIFIKTCSQIFYLYPQTFGFHWNVMKERSLQSFLSQGSLHFSRNWSLIPVVPNIGLNKDNLESLLKCVLMGSNLQESDLIVFGVGHKNLFLSSIPSDADGRSRNHSLWIIP